MDYLSKYIEEKSVNSVEAYERNIQHPEEFQDERLERYLRSPFAHNRVLTAEDPIEERKKLENIFHLSNYYNFDMGQVNKNYDAISRHYFGEGTITTNNQAIKDSLQAGKLSVEIDELKSSYMKTTDSKTRELIKARIEFMNSLMPPEDVLKRNLPVASAKEFIRNVPNWQEVFEKTTPFKAVYDHMKQVNELRDDNPLLKGNIGSLLVGLIKYSGEAREKSYIPTELAFLGGGAGMVAGAWKVYTDREVASTYYELQNIKVEDAEGNVIELDDKSIRAISLVAGGLKAAAEVWSDVVVFKGIPGVDKIFEKAFTRLSTTAGAKIALNTVLTKVLGKGVAITGSEILTEWTQATIDLAANDFAIFLDDNSQMLKDFKVTKEEIFSTYKEVLVKTALATAPLALLGIGGSAVKIGFDSFKMENIVKRNVAKLGDNFTTKAAIDLIKEDPEFQAEIGQVPKTTIIDIANRKEALITQDFVNAMEKEVAEGVEEGKTPITQLDEETGLRRPFDRGSDEFNVARETFKKENFDQYYQARELNEVELRKIYQETIVDAGLDQDAEGLPGLTYEQFRDQRFELASNYTTWRKTADAQKYLSTLSPAVEAIQRVIKGEITDDTGGVLIKHSEELGKIVAEAKAGGDIQTIFDFNLEKDLQIEALESEIEKLQELGRVQKDQNRTDQVNARVREYIEAKHELSSSRNELSTILELVAREIFDENRIVNTLAVSAENLASRLQDIESPEYKKFLSGQIAIDKIVPKIKEVILAELQITDDILTHDSSVNELVDIIDKQIVESVPTNVKAGIKLEEEYKNYIKEIKPQIDRLYEESSDIFDFRLNTNEDLKKTFFSEAESLNIPKHIAQYIFDVQEITEDSGLVAPIRHLSESLKDPKKALFIARYIHKENFNKDNLYIQARLDFLINPSPENANRITETLETSTAKRESEILSKAIEQGRLIERTDSFRNLIIGVIQKSLSNFLKLNGERYINSIKADISKNISKPRAEVIEKIQKAVTLIEGIKEEDIDSAKEFVAKNFYDIEGNPIESIQGPGAKTIASTLFSSLEITFDENLDPVGPRMSLQDLIHLKTEVDLLRYLGKVELSEAKKGNLISDEIRKSEFLVYQDSVVETSDKKKSILKGLNFDRQQANQWGKKIFGKQGVKLFWADSLRAFNEKAKKIQKRTNDVELAVDEKKYKWGEKVYEKRVVGNHEFDLQTLMFFYVNRNDPDIRTSILYKTPNSLSSEDFISLEDMTSYIGEIGETGLIDEELKEYEKKASDVFANDLRGPFNDISVTYAESTGQRLGFLEAYFPLIKKDFGLKDLDQELAITMLRGTDQSTNPSNKNFLLERKETTKDNAVPIRTDLFGIWQDYVQKQEHYINLNEWVRKAKVFMDDSTIKATITENYDKTWTDGIIKYIDDIAIPGRLHAPGNFNEMARRYKHNIALANLAGKLNIILRQIPSALLYVEKAGIGNWMNAHRKFTDPDNWYWKDRKLRNKMEDFINEVDPFTIKSGTEFSSLIHKREETKLGRNRKKIDKVIMDGINITDRTVKIIGWTAIYDKYEGDLGKEGAIAAAREWTAQTQPSSNKATLPGMYRHSEGANILFMFTQQPVKLINHLTGEVAPNFLTKEGSKLAGMYGLTALALSNLMIWSLTNRRIPEDGEDLARGLLLGALGWLPAVGRAMVRHSEGETIYSTPQFIDPAIGVVSLLNPLEWKNSINAAQTGDMSKFNKQFTNVLKGTGVVFGVPSSAISNINKSFGEEDWWSYHILGGALGEKK